MRSLFFLLGLISAGSGLFGQQAELNVSGRDDAAFSGLKKLTLPAGYASLTLPSKKDNSQLVYFPGIYSQEVWNCNQAASVWTLFTYEINYLRNLNSSVPENQYSPMAVYNLLRPSFNDPFPGVSYFDSWSLIKANGIPGNTDFSASHQNQQMWMTGYEKYYRGMKNRVDEVFAIDVGNPEGLLTLKHWINDHLDGSPVGGLANFQIGSDGMVHPKIPKGLEAEEEDIMIRYGPDVGHAMTFVGWNDSVRYDLNGDGRYTNTIDINNDGLVDMRDWEIGAMLVVNSWGSWWGNSGKVWVMYRLLAESTKNGGIWNQAAMVVKPKKTYDPLLTVKTQIRYNQRNRLKIQIGVSDDLNDQVPERVMDFICFNYQGDTLPMQGFTGVNSDVIELGLDITPLMNYIPASGQAKIFLEIIQKSPDAVGSGRIESFSVMDYTQGSREFVCSAGITPIGRNKVTRLSVPVTTTVTRPAIITEDLPDAQAGLEYQFTLETGGSIGPYRFTDPSHQYTELPDPSTIDFTAGTEVFTIPGISARVMDLPFYFPFYGATYNQITILTDGGIVMGQSLVKYPYAIDKRLRLFQNNGIFPFLSSLFYPDSRHKVTFAANAAEAVILWQATLDPEGYQPVEFAVKILPDGKIGMYYGNVSITPDISWISGISAGNNMDYHLMNHNDSGLKLNSAFRLELLDWPAWLHLASNGELYGTPIIPGTYTLPLKVTDWNGICNQKELKLIVDGSSIVQESSMGRIRVFPNPASDVIWIQGNAEIPGCMNFTLYDLTGNRIFTRQYPVFVGQVMTPLWEIKTLVPGIYLYRIDGVFEATGRIIRQ